jgi:hypothetical protein
MAASYRRTAVHHSGPNRATPACETLRDPRRQLLSALVGGGDSEVQPIVETKERRGDERYILSFDGGSRENPGPGGEGAVLVSTDEEATNRWIAWSASVSCAQRSMTNNPAEYHRTARSEATRVDGVGCWRKQSDPSAGRRVPPTVKHAAEAIVQRGEAASR